MNWKEEPKAIKKALQENGFTVVHSKKGKGTGRAWNHITVMERMGDWKATYEDAERIAEYICGHNKVCINVK